MYVWGTNILYFGVVAPCYQHHQNNNKALHLHTTKLCAFRLMYTVLTVLKDLPLLPGASSNNVEHFVVKFKV